MRKIKPFSGRKDVRERLVLRDTDIPSSKKPSVQKDGSIKMDEMEQLKEIHSLDVIRGKMIRVLKQKSKSAISKLLDEIEDHLYAYSEELDEIGDGYAAKKARKLVKTIPDFIPLLDKGSKVFFGLFKKFMAEVSSLDPSRQTSLKEAISYDFDSLDKFKNIKSRIINLNNSKGNIVDAPISLTLYRPLSESDRVLLEKQGVKFAKGVGMVIIPNAIFFALNKLKFRGDYQTTIAMAISAISKDGNRLVPIKNVYKETEDAYCMMVVPEKFVRIYTNLFNSSNKIIIHIK